LEAFEEIAMLEFNIRDMKGAHCVDVLTKALLAADHNAVIEFDLPQHLVRITNAQDVAALEGAIRDAGYKPVLTQA
jgi:copper chaperone